MAQITQHDLHQHMPVYSADQQDLGHVAEIYEDSFLIHKGIIFSKDRYFPYSAVASVENGQVHLTLNADEAKDHVPFAVTPNVFIIRRQIPPFVNVL